MRTHETFGLRSGPTSTPSFDAPGRSHTSGPQRARTSDVEAMADVFNRTYGPGSHPAGDPAFIARSLALGDVWVVTRDRDVIAGCAAVTTTEWHGVVEVGCLVVDPEHQGLGLATKLSDTVMEEAMRTQSFSLANGKLRCGQLVSMSTKHEPLPLHVTGHDGGIDLADGVPEVHAMATGANPEAPIRRAALPAGHPLRELESMVPWIEQVDHEDVDWPGSMTVGPLGALPHDLDEPVRPASIDPRTGAAVLPPAHPTSVAAGLRWMADQLAQLEEARIVTAYVLADKTEIIRASEPLGFRTTAWLPAWHAHDERRFDCLMLTRSAAHDNADPALLGLAGEWEQRLTDLLQPRACP